MNMNASEFLYYNVQPAIVLKLACENTGYKFVIEDGVITEIVKEK